MIRMLPPGVRRSLALTILLALIGGIPLLVVMPVQSLLRQHERSSANLSLQLSKYSSIAAAKPALESKFERIQNEPVPPELFLDGDSYALAGARLQQMVSRVIRRSNGKLISAQVLPPGRKEIFERVTLHVQATGPVSMLQKSLYGIEGGSPMLFIEKLDVRSAVTRSRKKSSGRGTPDNLIVSFDVFGYRPDGDS